MTRSTVARLMERCRVDPESGCWEWCGTRSRRGYGHITIEGRSWRVHRLAAALWLGFDSHSPLHVCHRCDNPPCFNPAHLFIGSNAENTADKIAKGRALRPDDPRLFTTARLTPEQVRAIRIDARQHRSLRGLARRFGVSHETIRSILRGRTYRHVA